MIRNIIKIDEEKCNGCGLCISACHEGALELIDGKAKLIKESYCDGLGDCLPECPTGAITIEKRDVDEYDEEAVKIHVEKMKLENNTTNKLEEEVTCNCPGMRSKSIKEDDSKSPKVEAAVTTKAKSELQQWPCQIKLVPVNAPYFDNAHLLIAADCTAFAYGNIHSEFMKNKITLIGCPKLDNVQYSEKLSEIIKNNNIKSISVLRMEVPCCGGITNAVKNALLTSGKMIPWNITTISIDGKIIED
jgi:ferredoxin